MSLAKRDLARAEGNVDGLKAVLRGIDRSISPETALWVLSRHPEIRNRHVEYQSLLEDPTRPAQLRYWAAVYLGKIDPMDSLPILHANLEIEDPHVVAGVIKAMGRIGDEESLGLIAARRGKLRSWTAHVADFAMILLAHRLEITGYPLPVAKQRDYRIPQRGQSRAVKVSIAAEDETAALSRSLAFEPLGMDFDSDQVFRLVCGPQVMLLLINRALSRIADSQAFGAVSRLLGILVHWDAHELSYAPILYVMSDPGRSRSQVRIHLVNPNGRAIGAGTGEIKGTQVNISIRGLAGAGNRPLAVACTHERGVLKFTRMTVGRRVLEKKLTEPLGDLPVANPQRTAS